MSSGAPGSGSNRRYSSSRVSLSERFSKDTSRRSSSLEWPMISGLQHAQNTGARL